jgi:hypothetical protein
MFYMETFCRGDVLYVRRKIPMLGSKDKKEEWCNLLLFFCFSWPATSKFSSPARLVVCVHFHKVKHCKIPLYFRYFWRKWIAVPLSFTRRYWVKNSARFEQNSGEHRYLATLCVLLTDFWAEKKSASPFLPLLIMGWGIDDNYRDFDIFFCRQSSSYKQR